jgi:threonine dehydrogenase-like Zn-dependent dehydrogenase
MSFTNFLETEILDHVFAGAAYTAPSTKYLALFTGAPGETGGGTEVSGGGYARQTVAFTTSGNTTSNNAAVEFPTATANYGTVTHVGVYDASSSGNLMAYAALSSNKTIETGDVFRVPSGDLDITLN